MMNCDRALEVPRAELRSCGEVLADAFDGVALVVVQGEEFEAVAQSLPIPDDGSDFNGIGRQRQRDFERNDLAGFEAAGERGADAVLPHFGGASPAGAEFAGLKHFDLQADVDDEAGKPAGKRMFPWGRLRGRGAPRFFSTCSRGLSFFIGRHAIVRLDAEPSKIS